MNSDKNDNKLDQKTTKDIEKQLLKRKEAIEKELQELSNGDSSGGAKFPDFGDKADENAQEIGEYSTNLATENVLEKTLRDIEGTLERIKKGEYGTCKYCGEVRSVYRLGP